MPADIEAASAAVPADTAVADIAVYSVVAGIAVEEPDCKAAGIEAVRHTADSSAAADTAAAQAAAAPCIPDFLSRRPGRIPYSP